jgi:DNA-binding NarL/FixJ family response regulator
MDIIRPMKIGIIDDNVRLARQLIQKLQMVENITILFNEDRGRKGIEWLGLNHGNHPDIILMDIEMPDMDGIETTFRIKQLFPGIRIIMLTVFETEDKIFNAIKAGATGYLLKDEKLGKMLSSFEEVMDGGSPMSALIASKSLRMMLSGYKPETKNILVNEPDEQLTKREVEVLEFLVQGSRNQEIAEKLFISPSTVKKHIENIYLKLQMKSRVELVNWYNKA